MVFLFIFFLVLFLLCLAFFLFVLIVWVKYVYNKWKVDKPYLCNNDYTNEVKFILNKYRKYKIKRVYLVKEPLKWWFVLYFSLCCFDSFKITKPYHTFFILVLEHKKKQKWMALEKLNILSLKEFFSIKKTQKIKYIPIQNKDLSLKQLLKMTQQRMGKENFFNFSLHKNNCQMFCKEIITTLNPSIQCWFQQLLLQKYIFPPFSLFLINISTSTLIFLQQWFPFLTL